MAQAKFDTENFGIDVDFEQALALVNPIVLNSAGRYLNDLEVELFKGAWYNRTYEQIADASGYSLNYLQRDAGPKFWKLLSQTLAQKVNKTTTRTVLEQLLRSSPQEMKSQEPQSAVDPAEKHEPDSTTNPIDRYEIENSTRKITVSSQSRELRECDRNGLPNHSTNDSISEDAGSFKRSTVDWGEAIDVSIFYGRTQELNTLTQWILHDRCRLVALLGMGGIGKSSLAVKIALQLQNQFDYVIWRSLRNAPPLETLLGEINLFLSNQHDTQSKTERLLHWLRSHRCLIVLDNVETILQAGSRAGYYLPGYEEYGHLFQMLGDFSHQSCVILTSREKPSEVGMMESLQLWVRSLVLAGSEETSLALLDAKGLMGTEYAKRELCDRYSYSPLALKIVSASIQSLFDGDIASFLEQDTLVFNGLRRLLDQQFERLSDLERSIMYWLTINREWTSIAELQNDLIPSVSRAHLLESLESLTWRSLIERQSGCYTQQPVMMEYITEQFIAKITNEFITAKLDLFLTHALIKTTVKDYIRNSQIRLILEPIANQCKLRFQTPQRLAAQCQYLIRHLKEESARVNYGAGNLLNLCGHIPIDVIGYDFSQLVIRQAHLVDAVLKHVNFQSSEFIQTQFIQSFGSILSIAVSTDGQRFVTADDTGKIQLWHISGSEPIRVYQGHSSGIWSIAFSPDSQVIISGGADNTVRLWDVNTGQLLKILTGHASTIRGVSVSPNGKQFATASQDCTIKVWDLATGTLLHTLKGHTNWVRSVAFSPDGTCLASGSFDHTIRLWEMPSGRLLGILKGHTSLVTGIDFSPKGNILASGSDDRTVRLWDVSSGRVLEVLEGHNHWIYDVAFRPDGRVVASGSVDKTLKLWDVETGQLLHTLQGHTGSIRSVVYSPDGQILVSGAEDQTIRLWNATDGKLLRTLQGRANWAMPLTLSPDGTLMATGNINYVAQIWDVATGQVLQTLEHHRDWVVSIAFSPDGTVLATGSDDFLVCLWDVATGRLLRTLNQHTEAVRCIAFSPDGRFLASGAADNLVLLWKVATGEVVGRFEEHNGWLESIVFSPSCSVPEPSTELSQTAHPFSAQFASPYLVMSSSVDRSIKLWDMTTGHVLMALINDSGWVNVLAFSPTGEYFATASTDYKIKIWETETGTVLRTLQGHNAYVCSIQFSPDGTVLATGGDDRTVRLWDVNTGQMIGVCQGHGARVRTVLFHPDGKTVMSSSKDEEIRFWDIETGKCLRCIRSERPYEGMNIAGVMGLTDAQKETLRALGAV